MGFLMMNGFSYGLADHGLRFTDNGSRDQLAVAGNCILAFQNLDHHWPGSHEFHQIVEKRAALVHGIELPGLLTAELLHSGCYYLQSGLFKTAVYFTDDIFGHGIRLNDRKRSLDWQLKTPCKSM